MSENPEDLRQRIEALEYEISHLKQQTSGRTVRKRSEISIAGLPLYDIALGPDLESGEIRGHARGILAIGDIATGVVAMGGLARGVIALGGCGLGVLIGIGGLGVGAVALGGLAVGLMAIGGGAVGVIAVGGGALGYYAVGGGAAGKYVISAVEHDPEAIRFFQQWIPGVSRWIRPPGH
jgi:hypothetical protein